MLPDRRAPLAERHLPGDLTLVQINRDERRVRRLRQRNAAQAGAAVVDAVRRSPLGGWDRLRRRGRALRRPRREKPVLAAVVAVLPRLVWILQVVLAECADVLTVHHLDNQQSRFG